MTDWPSSVNAITLIVDDLDEAKAFYGAVFQLPVLFEDDESAVFEFPNVLVNLLEVSAAPELIDPTPVAPRAAGSRSVFTLEVDDVNASCERLRNLGVAILNGPIDRPWGPRTVSFADPAGQIWELAQGGPAPR